MSTEKKNGFLKLAMKCLSVISGSSILIPTTAKAKQQVPKLDGDVKSYTSMNKNVLKQKLVLKLSSKNIYEGRLIAQHRSHSSHSSHSSHYSSSYSNGSDRSGSGIGIGSLIVGGAIAAGAYALGKSKRDKK